MLSSAARAEEEAVMLCTAASELVASGAGVLIMGKLDFLDT